MMCRKSIILVSFLFALGCTHDPAMLEEMDPSGGDTVEIDPSPPDSMTVSPTDTTAVLTPCDTETVYFKQQVLPILISNCTSSGCHNQTDAREDIVLTSYESVMASNVIKAGNLDESDLYEVLVEDDPDKRMPRPPADALNIDQINLIAQWIQQGADDLECNQGSTECNVVDISFSGFVQPLIDNYCTGCHSGSTPSGGVSLENYQAISSLANDGRLFGVISWSTGFARMPQNQPQLEECDINKIKSWIDDGAKNN